MYNSILNYRQPSRSNDDSAKIKIPKPKFTMMEIEILKYRK